MFSSSYFSAAYHSGAYWSGVGAAAASVSGGGRVMRLLDVDEEVKKAWQAKSRARRMATEAVAVAREDLARLVAEAATREASMPKPVRPVLPVGTPIADEFSASLARASKPVPEPPAKVHVPVPRVVPAPLSTRYVAAVKRGHVAIATACFHYAKACPRELVRDEERVVMVKVLVRLTRPPVPV